MKKFTLIRIAVIALILLLTAFVHTTFAQIPYDKKLHIGAGIVLSSWGTFAANSCGYNPEQCAVFGLATAWGAGVAKELADGLGFGTMDIKDLRATMYGGLIGTAVSYAGLKIFKKKVYFASINRTPVIGVTIKF